MCKKYFMETLLWPFPTVTKHQILMFVIDILFNDHFCDQPPVMLRLTITNKFIRSNPVSTSNHFQQE